MLRDFRQQTSSQAPRKRINRKPTLNLAHQPDGEFSVDEVWGLAALYNSHLLDTWFRAVNGSTQVNPAELRTMSRPPRNIIVALG